VKPAPFELEPPLDFLQHLWALNHALERTSLQMERSLGVTAQQRLILRCVGKYPGMTATPLATVLHLDRGTISVSLRRLMTKRLLVGRRDREGQRRVALRLTAKGRVRVRSQAGTVEHAVAQLLVRLGNSPVERTKHVLRLLSAELMKKLEP
jgi:MarR family transcriptional regulator, organic hydroperoxide resistance regulator